jgi:hypothetical protein
MGYAPRGDPTTCVFMRGSPPGRCTARYRRKRAFQQLAGWRDGRRASAPTSQRFDQSILLPAGGGRADDRAVARYRAESENSFSARATDVAGRMKSNSISVADNL